MDLNHPRDAHQVWTMEKITVLILCAQSIYTVDHTLNVKDDVFLFFIPKIVGMYWIKAWLFDQKLLGMA
jgi:hypothetical protein